MEVWNDVYSLDGSGLYHRGDHWELCMDENSKELKVSEPWSWSKFFSGFLDGRNYAKNIVNIFCMAVIFTVCFSVYTVVKSKFVKPHIPTVGNNSGVVINSTEDKHGNSFSLFNLFNSR
jgi:hypothetical protein